MELLYSGVRHPTPPTTTSHPFFFTMAVPYSFHQAVTPPLTSVIFPIGVKLLNEGSNATDLCLLAWHNKSVRRCSKHRRPASLPPLFNKISFLHNRPFWLQLDNICYALIERMVSWICSIFLSALFTSCLRFSEGKPEKKGRLSHWYCCRAETK